MIKARNLLAAHASAQQSDVAGTHDPRRKSQKELPELDDADDDDGSDVMDPFSSPVGGGGAAGKLLQRLMSRVRQLSGGGPPGADTPTHRSHKRDSRRRDGHLDVGARRLRSTTRTTARARAGSIPSGTSTAGATGTTGAPCTRSIRPTGRDIAFGTARRARVAAAADPARHRPGSLRTGRRRATTSTSTPPSRHGSKRWPDRRPTKPYTSTACAAGVISRCSSCSMSPDQPRRQALSVRPCTNNNARRPLRLPSRCTTSVTAWRCTPSNRRGASAVHVLPVKRFDDSLDALVMQRLGSLAPGAYSRLGAAIRHGTSVITEKAGTSRRLLVVLSDGLAYDHGYERALRRRRCAPRAGRGASSGDRLPVPDDRRGHRQRRTPPGVRQRRARVDTQARGSWPTSSARCSAPRCARADLRRRVA